MYREMRICKETIVWREGASGPSSCISLKARASLTMRPKSSVSIYFSLSFRFGYILSVFTLPPSSWTINSLDDSRIADSIRFHWPPGACSIPFACYFHVRKTARWHFQVSCNRLLIVSEYFGISSNLLFYLF